MAARKRARSTRARRARRRLATTSTSTADTPWSRGSTPREYHWSNGFQPLADCDRPRHRPDRVRAEATPRARQVARLRDARVQGLDHGQERRGGGEGRAGEARDAELT